MAKRLTAGWNTCNTSAGTWVPNPTREESSSRSFDQDGSGTIDIMELRQVMRHPKVRAAFKLSGDGKDQLSEAEIDAFANEMDKDGDGEISYDEFIAAMNKKEKEANKGLLQAQAVADWAGGERRDWNGGEAHGDGAEGFVSAPVAGRKAVLI
jgi:hypothetical protein